MAESPVTTITTWRLQIQSRIRPQPPKHHSWWVNPRVGKNEGPTPTRLLSVAIGHCLSSSLLFCLQKARIKVNDLQTTIKANVDRNKDDYLRIQSIDVKVKLEVAEEDKPRLPRCLSLFENYCTVTQSVQQGIKVNLEITKP